MAFITDPRSCVVCGGDASPLKGGCTNGCCRECHDSCCTGGGITSDGHALKPEYVDLRRSQLAAIPR